MSKLQLQKSFLLVAAMMFPIISSGQTTVDPSPNLNLEQICLTKGMENIKIKFPNISAQDRESISMYGCYCALKVAQQGTIRAVAADFRNVPYCIDYAVLRTSLSAGAGLKSKCITSYPHDVSDDSKNEDIADFCNCAAIPAEGINREIVSEKLTEDQIFTKLVSLIKGCRYSI